MEKYSKWRDKATGVHPFIPLRSKISESDTSFATKALYFILYNVIGTLLFILRALLIIILLLLTTPLSLVSPKVSNMIFYRGLLFLMGFYSIPTKYYKLQSTTRLPTTTPGSNISAGDIIISNHASYFEILYLAYKFSPVFASIPLEWSGYPENVPFYVRSTFGAIKDTFSVDIKSNEKSKSLFELVNYAKERNSPVVIFPEGTTSNGRAVLQCLQVLQGINVVVNPKVHVLGFKYDNDAVPLTYSIGSPFVHIYKSLCMMSNSMEVRFLAPSESHDLLLKDIQAGVDPSKSICTSISSILRVHSVALSAQDKQEFKDYWYGHKKIYKKEQ